MIVHASFLPHSPLLLETVHPQRQVDVAETHTAIASLSETLYAMSPDILVVISGHGERYADAFSIDVADHYEGNLRAFGDMSEPTLYRPATHVVDRLQRHLRKASIPFTLSTNDTLEYGSSVVLKLLHPSLANTAIIPIAYKDNGLKEHVQFGQALRDILDEIPERVAIIAAGDLSHCLSSDAPGGFCKEGPAFDEAVLRAIRQNSLSSLLSLPEELILHAHESGLRPLLILLGLLDKRLYEAEILSYEHPFGVGYLVAEFHVR